MVPTELHEEQVDIFGLTDQGKKRSSNQDHFLISSLHKTMLVRGTSLPEPDALEVRSEPLGYFLVVADGVGGNAGGREASSMTLQTIARYVTGTMKCYYGRDLDEEKQFVAELSDSIGRVHSAVLEGSHGPDGVEGMATTLTMAIVVWPKAYVVQVGDSRCYRLHDGDLVQLTRDQTMAQELADEGVITPEQAERSRLNHILSSAIGGPNATPVVTIVDLEMEDTLLLCSDGLIKHVSDSEIEAALRADSDSRTICSNLVQAALDGGGSDNVTVVVGRARRD